MSTFAAKTTVTVENSKNEIERTLVRYDAEAFSYGWDQGQSIIQFVYKTNIVKFRLPMPKREDFTKTPAGKGRTQNQVDQEINQARRQRWRALALIIKAKLEAVEAGIVTFEGEFLSNLLLPDGSIVGDHAPKQLAVMRQQIATEAPEIEIIPPRVSRRIGNS